MKRLGICLLAIVYVMSTAGTVVNIHYCMGHIVSVQWDQFGRKTATCGAFSEHSPCCHSDARVFKIGDVHQGVSLIHDVAAAPAPLLTAFSLCETPLLYRSGEAIKIAHGPPLPERASLCIQHCQFRI
jgi:hypothetical protein